MRFFRGRVEKTVSRMKWPHLFSSPVLSTIQTVLNFASDHFVKSRMNENSYQSCSDYFQSLRDKTCKIDSGIDRLSKIWKMPHLLIGGYGERSVEMDTYLEELWIHTRNTKDAIEKFKVELEPSLEETDQFLNEAQTLYDDMKAQSDNIDTVLAEYGYHYEEHRDSMLENNHRSSSNDCTGESILNSEELEVEFTPNLTWKYKAKLKESNISISNQRKPTVTCIATPVIKSLASISLSEKYEEKDSQ